MVKRRLQAQTPVLHLTWDGGGSWVIHPFPWTPPTKHLPDPLLGPTNQIQSSHLHHLFWRKLWAWGLLEHQALWCTNLHSLKLQDCTFFLVFPIHILWNIVIFCPLLCSASYSRSLCLFQPEMSDQLILLSKLCFQSLCGRPALGKNLQRNSLLRLPFVFVWNQREHLQGLTRLLKLRRDRVTFHAHFLMQILIMLITWWAAAQLSP